MCRQGGFDLTGLYAKSAEFDLLVSATAIDEATIGSHHGKVTAAVHAAARPERTGDKAFCRKRCASPVSASQARTGDIQLTGHTGRAGNEAVVEHVQLQIFQRHTDQAGVGGVCKSRIERGNGGMHRRLGDAVHVEDLRCACDVAAIPAFEAGQVQRFAAEYQRVQ